MADLLAYAALAQWIESRCRRRHTVLVAVDGHGGSGKSSFADRLAAHMVNAGVIHTDDFAEIGVTHGLNVERLRTQVIEPLSNGEDARYQRYDWASQALAEWRDVQPGGVVIVEGVSSMRREFGDPWDLTVWIETPRSTCLARGLERDGQDARQLWELWLAEEDEYIARDDPRSRADLIVAGAPAIRHDPSREVVVLEDRRVS